MMQMIVLPGPVTVHAAENDAGLGTSSTVHSQDCRILLVLRNGDGVEGVVEVAADLLQIKSPHHPAKDHVEQLQAL